MKAASSRRVPLRFRRVGRAGLPCTVLALVQGGSSLPYLDENWFGGYIRS